MLPQNQKNNVLTWVGRQLTNVSAATPSAYLDPLLSQINPMWVREYTAARLKSVIQETPDTKTFVLQPSRRWKGFKPGQHVMIGVEVNGTRHQRTFSVSSNLRRWELRGEITLTIKRFPGGLVTNFMHDELMVGDTIQLGEAYGDFNLPQATDSVFYLAGGSGITPVLSHLETLSMQGHSAPVTLLYYVRTSADIIAEKSLKDLSNRWPAFQLKVVKTHEGEEPDLMKKEHLEGVTGLSSRQCYLCGPQGLMELAGELLADNGVKAEQVHQTFFKAAKATLDTDALGGQVNFSRSGVQFTADGSKSLLEEAESQSLSPQHGCRIGICHQCTCVKKSGTVVNSVTGVSSGPGEETIQICISVPRGDVEVDL